MGHISYSEMDYVSKYLHNEYELNIQGTLEYAYNGYGVMPSSKLNNISSKLISDNLNYLGSFTTQSSRYDLYANEASYEVAKITSEGLISGNIELYQVSKDTIYKTLNIHPEIAIEDITATVDDILNGRYDETVYDAAMEAEFGPAQSSPAGQTQNAGGGVEDITATTNQAMKNDGLDLGADNAAGDMGGDDFGDFDTGGENGEGGGEAGGGDSPEMLDDQNEDEEDNDDEGTKAKKRVRKNLYKLHTIIKDNLDAMSNFTPAYEVENSRKYYRVQSILNTEDTIILKILREDINNLTVEDLMKKYTTLCQILDISTRYMHEFKKEYKEISEKHRAKLKNETHTETAASDSQLQQ